MAQKSLGILGVIDEVFSAVAEVVDGSIFGESNNESEKRKPRADESDISGSEADTAKPKPSGKQKLAAAFTPAKPAEKKGTPPGNAEPSEGDDAASKETAE